MEGFDLEERTAVFGEAVIAFCKQISRDDVNSVLVRQLVRAGTSVGANYSEANNAESRPDFKHKIGICRKESCEAKHWLRMLGSANPNKVEQARKLWQEAHQLNLLFSKIRRGIK
jgi:four helix bundle protein